MAQAKFNIGDKVQSVRSNEKGTITKVFDKKPGRQLYGVTFDNGQNSDIKEEDLLPIFNSNDPFECCANNLYGSNLDFTCINTSYKIRNTNNNTISSLKASKTIFKAYQFKPLLKFLNSRNRRVLIADEVGLGKTIEAGHIMLELHARRELKNALIICPKSLHEKWQTELKDKFGFDFTIVEEPESLINDLKNRDGFVRAIINYEKIRLDKNKKNKIHNFLEKNDKHFDFILCDEAHKLRNRNLAFNGLKSLLEYPCAAVFLTATPIMINEENLFNLLSLLDKNQYGKYAIFQNSLEINKPFINAISQVNNNVPFSKIKEDLQNAEITTRYSIGEDNIVSYIEQSTIKKRFADSPLYKRIISNLESGNDNDETRIKLQFDISSLSPMNTIFSRTRKREITTDNSLTERDPHTIIVKLHEEELQNYENIINESPNEEENDKNGLGIVQRKRMFSSSIFASLNKKEDLEKGIDRFADFPDSKVENLIQIVDELKKNNLKHLIVFAIFKQTLKYLAIRLAKYGIQTIRIDGDVSSEERFERIQKFKDVKNFTILLSSEVGSEGLDMQFCNAIVNYDLPWNPMVVEQRIGRIDRFGQESKLVHIYNLLIENSIQVDVYNRLLDRIELFRNSIGDIEAILDRVLETSDIRGASNIQEYFEKLEKEIYTNQLTKEQGKEQIKSIANAIIREKENLEKISQGLTNTLTNDIYFKKEINSINEFNRYVTEKDLYNYISLLINKRLPSCTLEEHKSIKNAYTLTIPNGEPKILINFLEEFAPIDLGQELEILNKQFQSHIRGKKEISLTFNQDVSYKNRKLEFINAYHPLVTSAYQYFHKNSDSFACAFNFEISKSNLDQEINLDNGDYYMALYVLVAKKQMYGKTQEIELLTPIVYDVQNEITIEDKHISELIYAKSQETPYVAHIHNKPNQDIITDMRYAIIERLDSIIDNFIDDQKVILESYKNIQRKQYEDYYNFKIQHLKERYDDQRWKALNGDKNMEKILPATETNIKNMESERDDTFATIDNMSLTTKEPKLLSISYIKITD